ncbi:MAG: isoleucine--tRNA ligase, partial [Allorhizobium sp.]
MTDTPEKIDYSKTLYLPETEFPMRAGLPQKEPEMAAKWKQMGLYKRLRASAAGREKFVLHDGPPYANGNIHIGHALNKVLKDVITRSFQMRGFDSNYVPGWDCHGLPIEWKIEEKYREKGKDKNEVPVNEFRKECREFAQGWINIQAEEFRRLGIEGDFDNPYTTMAFHAEARIAGELLKIAMSGQLYRGSKPIMWSVVERTALAEAEVEYAEVESDTIWVKFPVVEGAADLKSASVVIWTTTPWTIPGNRAISYSSKIEYGLYQITEATNDFGPQPGEQLIFAKRLAEDAASKAKVTFKLVRDVTGAELGAITCAHPLKDLGYTFAVPMLDGDHVTDDAGTGFVHTAPSHGREDFEAWMANVRALEARGIDVKIPFPVDDAGFYTEDAPGFGPSAEGGAARVLDDNGKKGDANKRVMDALIKANNLFARGRIKHEYPHSWRSKKPVIFRNTPQWFVYMDKDLADGTTLRSRALSAIDQTRFVPAGGQNRLRAMIEQRPDWVLSRQRAWGVPICVFADAEGNVLQDEKVNARILEAFEKEGADAWFAEGAKQRFLGSEHDGDKWQMVSDILDVWFDSGSTHTFTLEDRPDLKWPADVYLEGSDQHRGWFHSSLLESCATRGRAPYNAVITHGFTMAEDGRKMSKSLGNTVTPQDVMKESGADILRLWVMSTDYAEDQRLGK